MLTFRPTSTAPAGKLAWLKRLLNPDLVFDRAGRDETMAVLAHQLSPSLAFGD